jgi:hypothetical protein
MLKASISPVTSFSIAALRSDAVRPQRRLLGLVDLWWLANTAAIHGLQTEAQSRPQDLNPFVCCVLSLCGLDVAYDGRSCRILLCSIDRDERVSANDWPTHRHSVQAQNRWFVGFGASSFQAGEL